MAKNCLKEYVATDQAILISNLSHYGTRFHQRMSEGRGREKRFRRRLPVRQLGACCIKSSFAAPPSFTSWSRVQFSPHLPPIRRIWRKHFENQLHCCLTHRLPGGWMTQSRESETHGSSPISLSLQHFCWMGCTGGRGTGPPRREAPSMRISVVLPPWWG